VKTNVIGINHGDSSYVFDGDGRHVTEITVAADQETEENYGNEDLF